MSGKTLPSAASQEQKLLLLPMSIFRSDSTDIAH
jgi:hypothetical protein